MRLTLLDLPHADDLVYPLTTFPVRFVTGDRDTEWAEDEHGRTWMKDEHSGRWRCCMTLRSGGAS